MLNSEVLRCPKALAKYQCSVYLTLPPTRQVVFSGQRHRNQNTVINCTESLCDRNWSHHFHRSSQVCWVFRQCQNEWLRPKAPCYCPMSLIDVTHCPHLKTRSMHGCYLKTGINPARSGRIPSWRSRHSPNRWWHLPSPKNALLRLWTGIHCCIWLRFNATADSISESIKYECLIKITIMQMYWFKRFSKIKY